MLDAKMQHLRRDVQFQQVEFPLLVGLGVAVTMEWDRQRNRSDFTREAASAAQSLAARLRGDTADACAIAEGTNHAVVRATRGGHFFDVVCRAGDPMAVTDNQGRVKGVQGLRVVDASVFPIVPCANTNFPTLMTAEKIANAMVTQ